MKKFIARHPVFTHDRVAFGYELLFRSGPENFLSSDRSDQAAPATADNLLLIGIDRLTQGRSAFINCTREFLVRESATILPKDRVVLETIEPDDQVIGACARLKHAGHLLASDDFQESPGWGPLVALANFIKVDSVAAPRRRTAALCPCLSMHRCSHDFRKSRDLRGIQESRRLGIFLLSRLFLQLPGDDPPS